MTHKAGFGRGAAEEFPSVVRSWSAARSRAFRAIAITAMTSVALCGMVAPSLAAGKQVADKQVADKQVAGNQTGGKQAAGKAESSEDLAPVIGKQIWYAPHMGCLDRLMVRQTASEAAGAKESWIRRFPEREMPIRITDAVKVDGKWLYRFAWTVADGGGVGQTPAERVINDLRFEALPTTFYQTCFFLDPPQAVAGFLRAQQPLALQRYDGPSAAERRQEIERIEAQDRRRTK